MKSPRRITVTQHAPSAPMQVSAIKNLKANHKERFKNEGSLSGYSVSRQFLHGLYGTLYGGGTV